MLRTNPDAEDNHNIFRNWDKTRGILIELVGESRYYYYFSADRPYRKIRFCHSPDIDTPDDIYRARKEGRGYVYWLSTEYFLMASSINPISYSTSFDLYYWSVDDKGVLGPKFICSIPAESKSNHIRLCLVPELCRMEFNNDLSMQINPSSGELEYSESRKNQLIAGYDDKLSVNSSLGSRCFIWLVIDIPTQ
jgi:hypothetical protein